MLTSLRLLPTLLSPSYWLGLGDDIKLAFQLIRDGRVPIWLKILPLATIIYILSPIDLIPGFIPIIGQLDDLALMLLMISLFIRLAPAEVVADYRLLKEPT